MKARHIIMIFVLIIFASIIISLKDAKDTEKLVCVADSDFQGMESKINLEIKVKDKKIKDMNLVIDSVLPNEALSQKQTMIASINASGKMEATSTEDGIRFRAGIGSEYFGSLGINANTKIGELKEVLELQGYSCK